LAVFRLLVQVGGQGLAAGEIPAQLNISPISLSTHLSILAKAGLIAATRDGRSIRYSADMAGLRALLTWLLQDCCGGKPEICAPVLDALACNC
jgi:DNA-binding transcriptional ArsR family regulator